MGYSIFDRTRRRVSLARELDRILSLLKQKEGIKKIYLVGSLARDQAGPASDIDLVLVQESQQRPMARLDALYAELDPRCALDLFVYTPDEFVAMSGSNRFIRHALREGKLLYAG